MCIRDSNVTTKHTANHIDVGSTVQLGNAGIITATTLIGNVTGNVNSTSNLLLQISGSEKFRVGNGGQFGIAGANYGTAGQVFTSGGSGSAPTWSTINSDKITEGNTEAEVVDTGSDGHFKVTTEGSERFRIDNDGRMLLGTTTPGNSTADDLTIATSSNTGITLRSATNGEGNIFFGDGTSGADQYRGMVRYYHNDDALAFHAAGSERLRIASNGQVSISSDGTTDGLLTIKGDTDQVGTPSIRLLDGSDTREVSISNTSGDFVVSVHGNDNAIHGHIKMFESGIIDFNNGGASGSNVNRLRIDTSGHMGLGVLPNTNWPTNNDFKALQIGTGACVFGRGSGDEDRGGIAVNWYSDGSNNKYLGNGNAARIYLADGNIYFSTAGANSSGANAAMTLNDKMILSSSGRLGIAGFQHNYTMNSQSTDLVIGDGGGGRGITLWTAAAADNQTISFQTNETLSRAEGEISYGPTATSTAADRNAMMFRTNSAERLRITSTGKVQLPTANSTNTYLNVKNIGISRISTSERLAITDIGAVAYDYELDDIMVYRSAGYWSGIDNPNRRGRIRTRNLRAAINFDIGWNYNTPYMSTITPLHSLTEGSNLSYFGNPFSDMPNTGGLDNGPYWNRSPDEANDGIVADMGTTAPTAKVSLLCWYKSDSNNSQGTGSGGSWGPQVWLFGDTRNSVSGGFGISNSKPSFHHGNNLSVTATSSPSVVDGSWHHIAYVWDGPNNDLKMFTDGTLYYTNTNLQNINSNIQFDRIGSGYNYSCLLYTSPSPRD